MKQLLNTTASYTANTEIARVLFEPDNWRRNLSFIENQDLPRKLWLQAVKAYDQENFFGYIYADRFLIDKKWAILVLAPPLYYHFRNGRRFYIDEETYNVICAWKKDL